MVESRVEDLLNGEAVRHLETKDRGHIEGSFVRDGEVWYRVGTLFGDTIEEWKASELREAPEVFSPA
jgi:hypothetical protein